MLNIFVFPWKDDGDSARLKAEFETWYTLTRYLYQKENTLST